MKIPLPKRTAPNPASDLRLEFQLGTPSVAGLYTAPFCFARFRASLWLWPARQAATAPHGLLHPSPRHRSATDLPARKLDSPENREKFRVPPEINDIRIENGELAVAYR